MSVDREAVLVIGWRINLEQFEIKVSRTVDPGYDPKAGQKLANNIVYEYKHKRYEFNEDLMEAVAKSCGCHYVIDPDGLRYWLTIPTSRFWKNVDQFTKWLAKKDKIEMLAQKMGVKLGKFDFDAILFEYL